MNLTKGGCDRISFLPRATSDFSASSIIYICVFVCVFSCVYACVREYVCVYLNIRIFLFLYNAINKVGSIFFLMYPLMHLILRNSYIVNKERPISKANRK